MNKLTKKEIEIFGRVLRTLGDNIAKDPEVWAQKLGLASTQEKEDKSDKSEIRIEQILGNFELYEIAKSVTKEELLDKLKQYSLEELKFLLKKYKLGYSKVKSRDSLAEYIADQAKKRTTDVFQTHEM